MNGKVPRKIILEIAMYVDERNVLQTSRVIAEVENELHVGSVT